MWGIRLDTATGRLALEVRDADVLLTHFYTLEVSSHSMKRLYLPQAQAWWQGLEEATDGLLFLHGYGDRKLGQHRGILAMSAETGSLAWEQPLLAFYGLAAEGLLAFTAAKPEASFTLLHTQTGKVLQEGISQQEAAGRVQAYNTSRFSQSTYPTLYLAGEEYFTQVGAFLQARLGVEPKKAIEYAETEGCFIVSFYGAEADGKLSNRLAVFDLAGELQINVQMGTGLSGIGSDTFFIFKDELYFILNKDTLKAYRLLV
ncbi:uncharacterized protein DUF4905 [Pontibacter ummariensis]|uniref:DUF4905 domain-containing protein n=1 Tax=Pontibacter ummariensis TaxID=1610492 RepID=A0A239KQ66_9BACT|nr:DUF4905 domain-containing protein [Pontibacter ummariensis]PRY05380.1 uncharacterized protein DUF4905 [Pontibacter ummariensis]SNT20185.1 protein of unknown function [Pontibacter ummariensis]